MSASATNQDRKPGNSDEGSNLWWIRLGSLIAGVAFVLYLIYTELFTLNAICLWCTSVHVITFLLFALVVSTAAVRSGTEPNLAARPTPGNA